MDEWWKFIAWMQWRRHQSSLFQFSDVLMLCVTISLYAHDINEGKKIRKIKNFHWKFQFRRRKKVFVWEFCPSQVHRMTYITEIFDFAASLFIQFDIFSSNKKKQFYFLSVFSFFANNEPDMVLCIFFVCCPFGCSNNFFVNIAKR